MYNASLSKIRKQIQESNIQKPEQNKKGIFLFGGQSGAGKSSILNKLPHEFVSNAIKIDPDEYRSHYPNVEEKTLANPEKSGRETQVYVSNVAKRLIDTLSNEGYNLIIDRTLANAEKSTQEIKLLKDRGYTCNVIFMCTNEIESQIGCLKRREESIQNGSLPRSVPLDFQKYCYEKLPDVVDKIHKSGLVESTTIMRRDGTIVDFAKKGETNDLKYNYLKEREKITPNKIDHFINSIVKIEESMKKRTPFQFEIEQVNDVKMKIVQKAHEIKYEKTISSLGEGYRFSPRIENQQTQNQSSKKMKI